MVIINLVLSLCAVSIFLLSFHNILLSEESKDTYTYLDLFAEAVVFIEKSYVDPVNTDFLIEGAIEKMIQGLDSGSYLKVKKEGFQDIYFEEFFFNEIGVNLLPNEGYVVLITVLKDSPLYSAGMRAGDIIRGIDDILVPSLGIYKFYNRLYDKILNEQETLINYISDRKPEDATIKFTGSKIKYPNISFYNHSDGFVCIKINSFLKGTGDEITAKLDEYDPLKLKGLLLDLRDCCNGQLSEALRVADIFLGKEKIVTLKFNSGKTVDYIATENEKDLHLPLVVITNENTVKLAELVAASMKSRPNTKLFGRKTLGKGKYQVDINLSENVVMHISKSEFIDPSGQKLENNGITPDFPYEKIDDENMSDQDDPLLKKGLELLENMI